MIKVMVTTGNASRIAASAIEVSSRCLQHDNSTANTCQTDGHWSDLCYTDPRSPAYGQRNSNNGGGQNNDQQIIIANNEQGSDNQQGNDDTTGLPQNSAHIQNMRQNYGTPVTMLYLALENVAVDFGREETIRVLEMMLGSKVHHRDLEGDVVMDADLSYSVSPKSEASTTKKVRFEGLPLLSFASAATAGSGVVETALIEQAIADIDVNDAGAVIKAIINAKGGEKYIDLEDIVS